MTVFEYEDEIIIVDCGLSFPDDEMLGIDVVIPDFTYLKKNKNSLSIKLYVTLKMKMRSNSFSSFIIGC